MTSPAEDRRNQFAMTFNSLLGRAGKTAYNYDDSVYEKNQVGTAQTIAASNARKKYNPPKPKTTKPKSDKKTASEITQAETEAFLRARKEELVGKDQPWWKDALGAVSRPLDLLNRPAATVVNAFDQVVDATQSGEPIWSMGDDAAYGAWIGLSGQSKRGMGDVIQNVKDLQGGDSSDDSWSNKVMRKLISGTMPGTAARTSRGLEAEYGTEKMDKTIPFTPGWKINLNPATTYDRVMGGVLDVAWDPTTYIGIGAATKMLKGGKEVGEDAVQSLARQGIEQSAEDIGKNLDLPAVMRDTIEPSTGKTVKELLDSPDLADQSLGKQFAEKQDTELLRSQKDAQLIADYESGKITADDFYKEYKKPGSVRSGGIAQIIKDAKKFQSPVEQVAREIAEIRKTQILSGTKSVREVVQEAVEERTHKLINEVQTRTQAGKIAGGVGKEYTDTIANLVTEQFRDDSLATANRYINSFKDKFSRGRLTTSELKQMRANDKYFDAWYTEFEKINVAKKTSLTDIEFQKAVKKADAALQSAMETEAKTIHAAVKGTVEDQLMGVPTLRMFGEDIAQFPAVGKAFKSAKTSFNNVPAVENFRKAFSYTANFPGYTSLISQKVKSLGVQAFESFRNDVIKNIRDLKLTKNERIGLTQSLVDNVAPTDPRLAQAFQFLRDGYDKIYMNEVAAGIRDGAKKPLIPNYTYTHVRNNSGGDFKLMSRKRDARLKAYGDLEGFSPADLKDMGFKVEEDAYKNLLIRQQKSIRKQSNVFFLRDLASHYGIRSSMSKSEALSRNLEKLDPKKVPTWEGIKLKPGEAIYIDRDIKAIHNRYLNLARIQAGDDLKQLMRTFDWVTRKFKTWNTIYFPAYHVRNMVGDMFMGFMDGVLPNDYQRVFGAMFENRKGVSQSTIRLAGHDVNFDKYILTPYKNNLTSSSFLNADIGGTLAIKNRTIPSGVRHLSELREDYGRITHFYRALDDELTANLNKGMSWDKAWENSINTASYRVNKFKFDYDALTAVEKKYVRRGIPFYTYIRKAAPVLLESLALQPRYLGTLNRWQTGLEEQWGDMAVPDWLREMAYMRIPGTDYGFTNDILPTGILNSLNDSPLSRLNPIAQTIIEANTGKDSFTGKTIEGDNAWARLPEVLNNKIRPATTFGNPLIDKEGWITGDNLNNSEKLARFFGFPLRKYDRENEQAYAEMKYQLKDKLKSVTSSIEKKGYTVYLSERKDGISLRVKDKLTDKVIFEGQTLDEVQSFVDSL